MGEKGGVGDSEGLPCPHRLRDGSRRYRAALAALQANPAVDPKRVVLVGHSMGGLIGPLLAAEAPVAGVAAISTAGLPWVEYTIANTRRQLALWASARPRSTPRCGAPSARHTPSTSRNGRRTTSSPNTPSGAVFSNSPSTSRTSSRWPTTTRAPGAAADAPALLVAGGADFVTDPAEHERIVAIVNRLRPGTARYVLVPDLDHFGNRVPDAPTSFRIVMTGGEAPTNDDLPRLLVEWADSLPPSR